MNTKNLICTFIFLSIACFMHAQEDTVRYQDEVYVDFIKSVAFHQNGLPTSYPTIQLGVGRLFLSFDDMGGSFYDYTYEVRHCNKDWIPSDINELEYLDGFNGERIESFNTAENTFVDYTNYQLVIPNRDLNLKISGNYLLIINDESGLPVITRRFIVSDPKVIVIAEMKKSPEVEYINSYQGITFEVNKKDFYISNPKEELYATVIQNGRWNEAIENLQPTSVISERITFNNRMPYSFPGMKEHRSFDIRTLEAATRNVHSIDLEANGTKAILELSKSRYFGNYVFENDANGSFVLANDNGDNDEVTGDYVDVYFTLKTMEVEDQEVYILGKFNDWSPSPLYKMTYDYDRKVYKNNLFFKQGYYDYLFGVVDETGYISTELLEGNSHQTENDYIIVIYQRSYSENYDQVIGLRHISSVNN